jgi:hypothetical protein
MLVQAAVVEVVGLQPPATRGMNRMDLNPDRIFCTARRSYGACDR